MELEDMMDLARRSRASAERAYREEAFWLRMIDERLGTSEPHENAKVMLRCVEGSEVV